MKQRKIPQRKCIGCHEMKDKRELVRVVKTKTEDESIFSLDFTGKNPGRGAYICQNPSCFDMAFKKKGLDRSFKQKIPAEIYEELKETIVNCADQAQTDS